MFDGLFDKPWLILVIVLLFIVMFGSRKLPGAARSLGQSMRILKKEMSGLHEDQDDAQAAPAAPAAAPAQLQATAPAPAPVAAPAPDAQAQLAALQEQLNSLQKTVAANGTAATDTQQTR
jgi:sec-independent protein translocase protein TatA